MEHIEGWVGMCSAEGCPKSGTRCGNLLDKEYRV